MILKRISYRQLLIYWKFNQLKLVTGYFAQQKYEEVNEELMKKVNISKVEMDKLWVIIEKKVAPRIENGDKRTWM